VVKPVVALLGLVLSFSLAAVARGLGPRLGAMDRPKALPIHSTPTPGSAGLALLMGFLLAHLLRGSKHTLANRTLGP